MSGRVNIEAAAWGDLRFATLARLLKLAQPEFALILCAKIWAWQTETFTPEAPTYVVDREMVETVLGEGGAESLVRARLGEETPDGIRMRGSCGRIEWLWKTRQNGRSGAEAASKSRSQKSSSSSSTSQSSPARVRVADPTADPAGHPPGSATLTPLTLVLDPSPDHSDLRPTGSTPASARAIPPAGAPPGTDESLRWCTEPWAKVDEHRARIAAKFGLAARPLHPFDRGRSELVARVREGGDRGKADVEHVIAVRVREAEDKQTLRWLGGGMFEGEQWRTALAMDLAAATRQARAGPATRGPARRNTRDVLDEECARMDAEDAERQGTTS